MTSSIRLVAASLLCVSGVMLVACQDSAPASTGVAPAHRTTPPPPASSTPG